MLLQALKARRQQPLDLSHLTNLTHLQLSAAVPLLAGDKLPASLLQLHARQCFDLQPLLHLTRLEVLSCRPSTMPGSQFLALMQLTALQQVKLFYEGGYHLQPTQYYGPCVKWDEERMQQHAVAWPKLPLRSLGIYTASGPHGLTIGDGGYVASELPDECLDAVAQCTGLTYLALDRHVGAAGLLPVVQQLTQLRQLSVWCDWLTDYFDCDGYVKRDYTPEELQEGADDVLELMLSIHQSRPRLQHLYWLVDIQRRSNQRRSNQKERMTLNLSQLSDALQELGENAHDPDGVDIKALYYAFHINLDTQHRK